MALTRALGEWEDCGKRSYLASVEAYSELNTTPGRDRMGLRLFACPKEPPGELIVIDLFWNGMLALGLRLDFNSANGQRNVDALLDKFIEAARHAVYKQKVVSSTPVKLSDSPNNPLGLYYVADKDFNSKKPPEFRLAEDNG